MRKEQRRISANGVVGVILFVATGVDGLLDALGRATILDRVLGIALGASSAPRYLNAVLMLAGLVLILREQRARALPLARFAENRSFADRVVSAVAGASFHLKNHDFEVLRKFVDISDRLTTNDIAQAMGSDKQKSVYDVHRLKSLGLLDVRYGDYREGQILWCLTQLGRGVLVEKGLLK